MLAPGAAGQDSGLKPASNANVLRPSTDNQEAFDPSLLPEEKGNPAEQSAPLQPASPRENAWPSASFSAFNYPSPGSSWYADGAMGAGRQYPSIDKSAEDRSPDQGVAGPAAALSFGRPVEASITSYFGWRSHKDRMHYGIDFAANKGTPIKASARGTVTWYTRDRDEGEYGKVVEINHGDGFTSIYAHCDSVIVSEGDQVEQGDVIGYVGNTGGVGYHLHFEIRHNGIPYNPLLSYL